MQKSKTETLIQKYLSHQLNEQELEELKLWIEEDASHREIFVKLLSLHHVNNQLNLYISLIKKPHGSLFNTVVTGPILFIAVSLFIPRPLQ